MSRLRVGIAVFIIGMMEAGAALAQGPAAGPAAGPAPAAAPAAAPVAVQAPVSLLDAGLFLLLAGGAVFAVCRGSKRV